MRKIAITTYLLLSLFVFAHAVNRAFGCLEQDKAIAGALIAAIFTPLYIADMAYKRLHGIKYECEKQQETEQ